MAENKIGKMRVTLVRSPIGRKPEQRATVKALGLGKLHSSVEVDAKNDALFGMVRSISHLLKVEEVKGDE